MKHLWLIPLLWLFAHGGITARALPLDPSNVFCSSFPSLCKRGTQVLLTAQGIGTNEVYVLEVDPTTGAIPVSGSISATNPSVSANGDPIPGSSTLVAGEGPTGDQTPISVDATGAVNVTGSITASNPSVGPTGDPVPVEATLLGGEGPTGDLTAVSVTAGGAVNIGSIAGPVALPTGAATEATLASVLADTANIDTATTALNGKVANDYGASAGAVRTASQIGNASGAAAFGAGAVSAQTLRVVLPTDQTSIPVTDNGGSITVDGTVAATQSGAWNITNITGTVSLPTGAATEATLAAIGTRQQSVVSTANSTTAPLGIGGVFTGTSEEVKDYGVVTIEVFSDQASATDGLSVQWSTNGTNWDDNDLWTVAASNGRFFTFGPEARYFRLVYTNGAVAQTVFRMQTIFHYGYLKPSSHRVNETISDESDAELVKAAPALRVTANSYVTQAGDANGSDFTTLRNGASAVDYNSGAASANTLRSVLATRHEAAATPLSVRISNGTAFTTPAQAGRAYADSATLDYSGTNVTSAAWVQLDASTAASINELKIFDSCGLGLELGTGAAAAESRVLLIPPGGFDSSVNLAIASGTRLALRTLSGTCASGQIILTGLN